MWLRLPSFKRVQSPRPNALLGGFTCFTLKIPHRGVLVASEHHERGTHFIQCRADSSKRPVIILCVPETNRRAGLLLASDGRRLATESEVTASMAVAVRLESGPVDAPVTLLHPINPRWRLELPAGNGPTHDILTFTHCPPHPDAAFILEEVEAGTLASGIRKACRQIATCQTAPIGWQTIIAAYRRGSLRAELVGPLLTCLPIDILDDFVGTLMADSRLRTLLRPCLKDDRWMSIRLDPLLAWGKNRAQHPARGAAIRIQDTDDLPGARKHLAHRPTLGLALTALVRCRTRPRRMACVIGSARNEGPYLLDWIAHHKAVGFDHIFLYTNDNTDGSDELLGLLARAGVITWLDNKVSPDTLPQFRAYAHALSALPQTLDYRWSLIADLDEYFAYNAKKFSSVSDYLNWQEIRRAEAIALPWLIYAAGRRDLWHDAACTQRFLMREQHVNHHIKSMFRTHLHWSSTCHNPLPVLEMPINYRAQDGTPHIAKSPENNQALAHNPQATHAWMAHYIFKSAPEAMMKIIRGKGDGASDDRHEDMDRMAKSFVMLTDKSPLIQDRRTLTCACTADLELTRLRAIRGVHDCERSIKNAFSDRMTAASLQLARQSRIAGEAEQTSIFRSILLQQRHAHLFRDKADAD